MILILLQTLKTGEVVQTLLKNIQSVSVVSDATYTVFDQATMKPPEGLILKRKGAVLEVEVEQEVVLSLEGFYDQSSLAIYSVDGSAGESMVVDASRVQDVVAGEVVDGVVWQASVSYAQNDDNSELEVGFVLGVGALGAIMNSGFGSSSSETPSAISSVMIPDAAVNVGDTVTVSILANNEGLVMASGTVNGVAVTDFTDNGGGNYSATYTVSEGDTDIAAGSDIPVSFVLADSAGNEIPEFTSVISQSSDPIDANTASINTVSIADAAMSVGDAVAVTITASEAGLSLVSGTVNGVAVTGFTDNGDGSYSANYTIAEGSTAVAADDDIPVSFVLADSAGNETVPFTTAISQGSDPIDPLIQ